MRKRINNPDLLDWNTVKLEDAIGYNGKDLTNLIGKHIEIRNKNSETIIRELPKLQWYEHFRDIEKKTRLGVGHGFWTKELTQIVRKASTIAKQQGYPDLLDWNTLGSYEGKIAFIGGHMEITAEMLKAVNNEAEESKKILEETYNQVRQSFELLEPKLIEMSKRIQQTRMTVMRELNTTLSLMRDVRKFFLEDTYQIEIERLKEFVSIMERFKLLQETGVLDAILDAMLKLAIREE